MLTQAVARPHDLDDDGMMSKRLINGDATTGLLDTSPLRQNQCSFEGGHRALLVTDIHELEEEVDAARHDRKVADLVHDQEGGAAEIPDPVAEGFVAIYSLLNNEEVAITKRSVVIYNCKFH